MFNISINKWTSWDVVDPTQVWLLSFLLYIMPYWLSVVRKKVRPSLLGEQLPWEQLSTIISHSLPEGGGKKP